MMDADIIRVVHDLKTFTAIDLANALEWPEGTAGARLSDWVKTGYVVRVKINRTFLYAIGPKAARIYAKLPNIDTEERCLPLSFEEIDLPYCPECGGNDIHIWYDSGISQVGKCRKCGTYLYRQYGYDWIIEDIPF